MKKYLLILLTYTLILPAYSFEDALVITNGKLNNIKIQHNDIIDVFPLVTIMNEKNTLIVHPLKEGNTKFSAIKNDKDKYIFSVNITQEATNIEPIEGFDILNIDCPPKGYGEYFDLDEPPLMNEDEAFINSIDEPPFMNGED